MFPGIPNIDRKTIQGGESDPLKDEIADFLQCILNETAPRETGEQGKQSLSIALEITAQIHRNEANHV